MVHGPATAPCIPTRAAKPPAGPGWVHEIKHDGYRLIVRRGGTTVRLFTRRAYDWTDRYPAIASTAAKLRARSFTIDGEAVVAGADGVAVFEALHRRHRAAEAILYAFDLLVLNGEEIGGHRVEAADVGPEPRGTGSRSRTRIARRCTGRGRGRGKMFDGSRPTRFVRSLMAIGAEQASIRTVIAGALAEHVSESGQSVDALVAIRQAEAIVKALKVAGYEIKRRT
jgi:hypothetical protein